MESGMTKVKQKYWRIYAVPPIGQMAVWTDGESVENITHIVTPPDGTIRFKKMDAEETELHLDRCAINWVPNPDVIKRLNEIWDPNFKPPANGPIMPANMDDVRKFGKHPRGQ
jgi:hypothetical protein